MLKKNVLVPLLIIIAVGFVLRIYRLEAVPLRGDEAFTIQNWMSRPLSDSLVSIATIEPHPFLNYVLFRIWALLAGTSVFSARFLPALVNLLGIPSVYAFGKRLFNKRIGLVSALLWAFHPFLIWHSQDARNYAIWSALSVLALWLGLRALEVNQRKDWWLYLFSALLSVNIFYFDWLTLVGFVFYAVYRYWKDWSRLGRLVGVVAVVFFSSFLSFVALQGNLIVSGEYGGTTGARFNGSELLTSFLPVLLWGESLPQSLSVVLAIAALVVLFMALFLAYRNALARLLLLVLVGFVPLLLLSFISFCFDVFAPRYVLSVVPAFIVLSAFVIARLLSFRSITGVALVVVWFGIMFFSLFNLFFVHDYAKSKNWPTVTDYLESRISADDLVIQLSVDPAFGYYYNGAARDIGLPAKPEQPTDDIIQELQTASNQYHSLWLVGQTFPDWPNYGVVEKWLQDHMQLVRNMDLSDLRVQQYMRWQVDNTPSNPLATFDQIAELSYAQVWLPPEPTGEITIWLYWRPLSRTQTPYKVFVHLEGGVNPDTGTPLWSQDDHYPQNDRISTTNWTPRVIYRDIYVLPIRNIPNGEYDLLIGWYNPNTGGRLLLPSGKDSHLLQTIKLP